MSNETIPLNLFKANVELQLRLQRLMQENGQQWLENATRAGSESIAESGAEIESLLKAQNVAAREISGSSGVINAAG